MAAPEGNTNRADGKRFMKALKRSLARKHNSVDEGLIRVANQLVDAAINGEQWAIKEMIDRFDGRAAQQTVIAGDQANPILVTQVERVIVHAQSTDQDSRSLPAIN